MQGTFTGRMRARASATLLVGAVLLAPVASAQETVELKAGGEVGSIWTIYNEGGLGGPLPPASSPRGIGDDCNGSPGMAVEDAVLDPDNVSDIGTQPNAYDNGHLIFVNGEQFAASDSFEVSDRSVLGGPETMSDLIVRVEYGAATTTDTLRTLVEFENPTSEEIQATVDHVTNVGSTNTLVVLTSSGDLGFDTDDAWIITSDSNATPTFPVISHVHRGQLQDARGSLLEATSVSQEAFECQGSQGVRATFDITVPAGEIRYLLFFNMLNQTRIEARGVTPNTFDQNPPVGGDLLFDLHPFVLLRVLNWDFRPECRGALKLKLNVDAKGNLRYEFTKGEATLLADFADPTTSETYSIWIVDFEEGRPVLESTMTVSRRQSWKERGNGYRYKTKTGLEDGITKIKLRRGEKFRTKIRVKGEGIEPPDLPMSQDPQVDVLITNSRGECWLGEFIEPAKKNTPEKFTARQKNKKPKKDEEAQAEE